MYYCDFNCCALILKNAKIASCIHEKKSFKRNLKKYAIRYGQVLLLILLAWLPQLLLGIFSLSSVNFLCTFFLIKKYQKIKDEMIYRTFRPFYGLVLLLILLAWLPQSLLGVFSLSSINFLWTFSLERKSTKKFKHAWGYNTCVHLPWFNCCITVTSTAVPWFLKMLRLLLVFMKRRDLKGI